MKSIKTKYGVCTISRNILNDKGSIKWCIREVPKQEIDSGWVFVSEVDSEDYLNDKNNWCIVPFETAIEKEPAILDIYKLPVGTEITFLNEKGKRYFVNTKSGELVK